MTIVHLASIDSTNLEAQRRWKSQSPRTDPILVRADVQTAGLGRDGRAWQSPAGGLWLSIAWPISQPADHYESLPPAIGSAVAQTIEAAFGLASRVKWPNDVMIGDRKLAGVLCQTVLDSGPRCVVVGVGLNANFSASILSSELRHPATTLLDQLGRAIELDELCNHLVADLLNALESFERSLP